MIKILIFLAIGGVMGYYVGNAVWRERVNSWVKKQLQSKGNRHK